MFTNIFYIENFHRACFDEFPGVLVLYFTLESDIRQEPIPSGRNGTPLGMGFTDSFSGYHLHLNFLTRSELGNENIIVDHVTCFLIIPLLISYVS